MIEVLETEEWWQVTVNGRLIATSPEEGICKRYARVLSECRNIPHRQAIKRLIEDIGYCEETAEFMYRQLFEYRNTGAIN